jgi:hypothetical protein
MRVYCQYIGFFNNGDRMPFAQTCTLDLDPDSFDADDVASVVQGQLNATGRKHGQTYEDIVVWLRDARTGQMLYRVAEPLPEKRRLA